MNAYIVAGVTLATIYFGVLVVVALEPHEPGRQGRHSRDQLMGARVSAPVMTLIAMTDAGGVT